MARAVPTQEALHMQGDRHKLQLRIAREVSCRCNTDERNWRRHCETRMGCVVYLPKRDLRRVSPMKRVLPGLCLVLLAACGRPEARYPLHVQTNFMGACQNQGSTQQRCACIWDKIEANIDPNSFAALEQLAGPERESHPLMQQIQQYSLACPSVPAGGAEPPPAP